jgi:hypothetical protein
MALHEKFKEEAEEMQVKLEDDLDTIQKMIEHEAAKWQKVQKQGSEDQASGRVEGD